MVCLGVGSQKTSGGHPTIIQIDRDNQYTEGEGVFRFSVTGSGYKQRFFTRASVSEPLLVGYTYGHFLRVFYESYPEKHVDLNGVATKMGEHAKKVKPFKNPNGNSFDIIRVESRGVTRPKEFSAWPSMTRVRDQVALGTELVRQCYECRLNRLSFEVSVRCTASARFYILFGGTDVPKNIAEYFVHCHIHELVEQMADRFKAEQ